MQGVYTGRGVTSRGPPQPERVARGTEFVRVLPVKRVIAEVLRKYGASHPHNAGQLTGGGELCVDHLIAAGLRLGVLCGFRHKRACLRTTVVRRHKQVAHS